MPLSLIFVPLVQSVYHPFMFLRLPTSTSTPDPTKSGVAQRSPHDSRDVPLHHGVLAQVASSPKISSTKAYEILISNSLLTSKPP